MHIGLSTRHSLSEHGVSTKGSFEQIMIVKVGIIVSTLPQTTLDSTGFAAHDEARDVEHTCQFLSNDVILRRQRKSSHKVHRKIQEVWEQFSAGDITAKDMLCR